MTERPGDFAYIFVHFPLSQHRFATPAGNAVECAKSFDRFHELVDAIFVKQDSLGLKSWTSFAVDAGVSDTATIAACANSPAVNPVIDSGRAYGSRLGVKGTPTLVVNGWVLSNPPDRVELLRIADALKKSDKPF
jgi:protein-disulfide isomerase